jgi:glutaredoxin 3
MAQVIVYSKSFCPFCDRAKKLLKNKGTAFEEINLDDKPDELDALKKRTGQMTVPMIFIDNKLIGGFRELSALEAKNELDPLLK